MVFWFFWFFMVFYGFYGLKNTTMETLKIWDIIFWRLFNIYITLHYQYIIKLWHSIVLLCSQSPNKLVIINHQYYHFSSCIMSNISNLTMSLTKSFIGYSECSASDCSDCSFDSSSLASSNSKPLSPAAVFKAVKLVFMKSFLESVLFLKFLPKISVK